MGVNLLVTTNNYDLPNVKIVDSMKDMDWSTVDCLIFHSTVDKEYVVGLEISKLKDVVKKVIYINESISPLYYCIFTGVDADIYDSEEYLMDASLLDYLIENYKNTQMTISSPDKELEILAKGVAAISSSDPESIHKLVSHPYWLKKLNTAVANVDNALARSKQVNINVVEMITEVRKLLDDMKFHSENLNRELEQTLKLVAELEKKPKPNTVFMFTTYRVPVSVPKVLYIKAYGNCRYLNSFVLAYQHYLKNCKQYSSKILIVLPKLKLYMKRYENLARLAQDSVGVMNLNVSDVYVTYEPKKIVLDTFFSQQNVQIFIVVDLMLDNEKLLYGHMVEELYALGSPNDAKMFNLDPERSICSITGSAQNIYIPHINRYAEKNESVKRQLYFEKCESAFKKIDSFIFKDRR